MPTLIGSLVQMAAVTLGGGVIVGCVWSTTVTLAVQGVVKVPFDTSSLTCVVPSGNGPV